jgi:hypothetical protein
MNSGEVEEEKEEEEEEEEGRKLLRGSESAVAFQKG